MVSELTMQMLGYDSAGRSKKQKKEATHMFLEDEKEKEYRHGNHGPKYLMKGPRSNFGLGRLLPGEVVETHVHKIMEENFYVLHGKLKVEINGVETVIEEGQMFHIEPGEMHTVSNPTEDYNEYIIACAPYAENDKYIEEKTEK